LAQNSKQIFFKTMVDLSLEVEQGIPNVSFNFIADAARYCVTALCGLALVDYFFARSWKGRYFVLHTLINLVISVAVLPDLWSIVSDPVETLARIDCSAFPIGAVFAIHFYHMLAPGFVLYPVDWLHHFLMVILGCPAIVSGQVGPIMNVNLFFICGVPGAIDYLMLALVKERYILPLTEKKYNNTIQVWIRAPALVAIAALCWLQLFIHSDRYEYVPIHLIAIRIFCISLNYWNGNYFMQRVCGNYFVTKYKLKEEYSKPDATMETRKELKRVASAADLQGKVLEDDIDDHPVESLMPGMSRNVKMHQKMSGKLWNICRGGS
jgi:hypothetical protein